MQPMDSAIYCGKLRHRRFSPTSHDFTYPLFMAFLDIDNIPAVMARSRLSSYNRWNWAGFDERDHFGDPTLPLRTRLEQDAAANGVSLPAGKIFLLTHLRYLGYTFNPVSFFFCYDHAGQPALVLAEVHNTFGESHNYWLDQRVALEGANSLRYKTDKVFHVSPFMSLNHQYTWTFTPPAENLVVHMGMHAPESKFFDATLTLERQPWTGASLRSILFRHPWMTAKVITAIHWEALRLLIKRVPVFDHPNKIKGKV
jgi:DUF1365 family protein